MSNQRHRSARLASMLVGGSLLAATPACSILLGWSGLSDDEVIATTPPDEAGIEPVDAPLLPDVSSEEPAPVTLDAGADAELDPSALKVLPSDTWTALFSPGTVTLAFDSTCAVLYARIWGAGGGSTPEYPGGNARTGGVGGYAEGHWTLTSPTASVVVGEAGSVSATPPGAGAGGKAIANGSDGASGGQRSEISVAGSLLLVAGAGGGACPGGNGGAGGGAQAKNAAGNTTESDPGAGKGASSTAPGAGASDPGIGEPGTGGVGPNGGSGATTASPSLFEDLLGAGGGGGHGYFGGGGGAAAALAGERRCGGGGGGSGFVAPTVKGRTVTSTNGIVPLVNDPSRAKYKAGTSAKPGLVLVMCGKGCTDDTQCTGGTHCSSGACHPSFKGATCDVDGDCQSGNCKLGTCN